MKNTLEVRRKSNKPGRPGRDVGTLRSGIDRLFDEFFEPFAGDLQFGREFNPACDIEETQDAYEIDFDLPGVRKEDIKIELSERQLQVSGERKSEREQKGKNRRLWERSYGTFSRSFILPSGIDPDRVQADFESGELRIRIPKSEESRARQIEIGAGKPEKAA